MSSIPLPFLLAAATSFFYAMANVILEQRLTLYHPLTTVSVYTGVICLTAAILRTFIRAEGTVYEYPWNADFLWMAAIGLLLFVADSLYVSAYVTGGKGNMLLIICGILLMPVFAVPANMLWTQTWAIPNLWQGLSYLFVVLAVISAAKGGE